RTAFASALATGSSVWSLRLCFFDFWCRRWLVNALRRTSLPLRVTRTRLAMPFCVLSLGICGAALLGRALAARRQDHEQVPALQEGLALDDRELLGVVRDPIEDLAPNLLV